MHKAGKTIVKSILAFVLIAAVGGGLGYAYLYHKYSVEDVKCKALADSLINRFVADWDLKVITDAAPHFSPETIASMTQELPAVKARLGPLKHYDGGNGALSISLQEDWKIVANVIYTGHATFQNGKMDIILKLKETNTGWEVTGINATPSSQQE